MLNNPRTKRILSVSLLILGGVLIFLAPEDIWIGVVLFAIGLGIEVAGARTPQLTKSLAAATIQLVQVRQKIVPHFISSIAHPWDVWKPPSAM
jgi:hypothetical protein